MIVYWIVTTLQSSDMKVVSNLASFIENFKIYIMSFLFILFAMIAMILVIFYNKIPLWVIPFVGILLLFIILSISLFPELTSGMDKQMEWFPKGILDKFIYSLVFLPLRMLYYYPYIFIQYIIPGIFSLFLSSSIIVYTITFIAGLLAMKYVFPTFEIDLDKKVFILWCMLYLFMIITNFFIKTKTVFFTIRQGFLFICLFLVFATSTFMIQRSDTIPEYLKLYLSFFIVLTCLIASFLFFYMVNIDYGKEFTDCNIFKPIIDQTASSDAKIQGIIPMLKKVLFAYFGIGISCYVIIFLSNKFFPMQQGVINSTFSVIIVILIAMIIIALLIRIVAKKLGFNLPPTFLNVLFALSSFLF